MAATEKEVQQDEALVKQEGVEQMQERGSLLPEMGAADAIQKLDARLAQWNAIRYSLIKQTRPSDWKNFAGNFYLADVGASELLVPTGFSLTGVRIEGPKLMEDDKGKFWYVRASGVAMFQGAAIEITRSLSSRDPFFCGKDGHIAYTEIRPENVEGKCVTQLRRKAVCTLFALNGLDPTELEKGGLNISKIKTVDFKSGTRGGSAPVESSQTKVRRLMQWVQGQDKALCTPLYRILTKTPEGEKPELPEDLDIEEAARIAECLEEIAGKVQVRDLAATSEAILAYATKQVQA